MLFPERFGRKRGGVRSGCIYLYSIIIYIYISVACGDRTQTRAPAGDRTREPLRGSRGQPLRVIAHASRCAARRVKNTGFGPKWVILARNRRLRYFLALDIMRTSSNPSYHNPNTTLKHPKPTLYPPCTHQPLHNLAKVHIGSNGLFWRETVTFCLI